VIKRIGTNTTTFGTTPFFNKGLVQVQTGTFSLTSGGTNAAQITVAAGASLNLGSGTYQVSATGSISGDGDFRLSGGVLTVNGIYDIGGSNYFSSGTATFAPGAIVNFRNNNLRIAGTVNLNTGSPRALNNLVVDNGLLSGADNVTATNVSLINSGDIEGTGILTIPVGGQIDFVSGEPSIARVCQNFGTARHLTAGRVFLNSGVFRNAGILEIHSNNSWNNGVFINDGTIIRLNGTNTASFSSVTFTNRGLINVQSGQLTFISATTVLEGGTQFGGSAALRFNSGTLRLGTNVNFGALNVVFSFPPTMAGVFAMANNVGGAMSFSNSVTLPGSLQIAGRLVVATNQTLTINGDLVAGPTAVIENWGQIIVKGNLQLNGAQVFGNAVQQMAGSPAFDLRIEQLPNAGGRSLTGGGNVAEPQVMLQWIAPSGQRFEVFMSTDLLQWTSLTTTVEEPTPGSYRARVTTGAAQKAFFRVRSNP